MKRDIEVFDHASEIISTVNRGVLLTSKARGRVNTMTISWGMLGIEWSKPQFVAFVRESRFTKRNLDENPEFTVNIPVEGRAFDRSILGYCGTRTGAEVDKIEGAGLTLVEPSMVSVPGILELPLTLECRITYKQKQDASAISPENLEKYYPEDISRSVPGTNPDFHAAYYGEIVAAYVIE